MSPPFPKRGDGSLYCYLCDRQQPDGTRQCQSVPPNNRGICGSVAFYRVRRPGGGVAVDRERRCDDCAFTRGTEANRTDHTTMLAALCVLGHNPFHCHVERRVCVGYAEALKTAPEKPNRYAAVMGEMLAETIRLIASEDVPEPAGVEEEFVSPTLGDA